MEIGSLREVIMWLKIILFYCLAQNISKSRWRRISSQEEKLLFSAFLVHLRKSLYEINRELLFYFFSKELFGKAPARFSRELLLSIKLLYQTRS
jgi:hypothetical protein